MWHKLHHLCDSQNCIQMASKHLFTNAAFITPFNVKYKYILIYIKGGYFIKFPECYHIIKIIKWEQTKLTVCQVRTYPGLKIFKGPNWLII